MTAIRLRIAFCLALGLTGCGQKHAAIELPPPSVTISPPVSREVMDFNDYTGRTDAIETVDIQARVSGYLKKVDFDAGEEVKAGDLLFEIDARPYQADLDRAIAQQASADARIKRATADSTRAEQLRPTGGISKEELDRVLADKADAEAGVASARAAFEAAKLNLEFTQITAPIDGKVSRALLTEGNLVQPGYGASNMLTTLVAVDPIYVYFDVDEQSVLRYQKLIREKKFTSAHEAVLPAYLQLGNEDTFPHVGRLEFIDNRIDPNTGTLQLRAVFDNPRISKNLREFTPGLFCRVRLPASQRHPALLISDRAVAADQGTKIVYVVDNEQVAHRREVKLGRLHDGLREVLSGINADDRVVVRGLQFLRDGLKVKAEVGEMPGSENPQTPLPPLPEANGKEKEDAEQSKPASKDGVPARPADDEPKKPAAESEPDKAPAKPASE